MELYASLHQPQDIVLPIISTKLLSDFSDYMNQKKKELSEFDKKLWTALHFNPKESKKGDSQ